MTDLPAESSGFGEDDAALTRIAAALDRIAPPPVPAPDFTRADAYVWHPDPDRLQPVAQVSRVPLSALVGIDRARDTLLANTLQFARGHAANNALLWGARGMGKSSLVKAVHAEVLGRGLPLALVEIAREDLDSVGRLLAMLGALQRMRDGDQHPLAREAMRQRRDPLGRDVGGPCGVGENLNLLGRPRFGVGEHDPVGHGAGVCGDPAADDGTHHGGDEGIDRQGVPVGCDGRLRADEAFG